MREVKSCVAVVSNPIGKGDTGEVAQGRFFVEGDWVTLCDEDGTPLRDEDTGARYMQRLEHGERAEVIAKRLTLRHYRAAHRDDMAGFHRRIHYPSRGWA